MASGEIIIRRGGISVPVTVLADGRFRVAMRSGSKWKRWTFLDESKARKKATEVCGLMAGGRVDFATLTPEQSEVCAAVIRHGITLDALKLILAQKAATPATVGEAIDALILAKETAAGMRTRHTESLGNDLRRLLMPLSDRPLASIRAGEIEQRLAGLRKSQRYLYNLRSAAVQLWRWSRSRGLLAEGVLTEAEKVEAVKVRSPDVTIYTPEEFVTLASLAREMFIPALAISAFAGVRSQEVAPDGTGGKRPLMWEDINWTEGHIDVHAHTSKTKRRRLIPMPENLGKWLWRHRQSTGPVLALRRHDEIRRLRQAGFQWKRNALRHSFGTYRVAALQNMPQVALEMGNSVGMIQRHYWAVVPRRIGEEWFGIVP